MKVKNIRLVFLWLCWCGCIAPLCGKEGVVLLHGLCRSHHSMREMEQALNGQGYHVVNVDYESRTFPIEVLGKKVITDALDSPCLKACERVHFVTHSMGGILVRYYLHEYPMPNLGRVVMLGPPNQGSEIVDALGKYAFFKWLNGPAGGQLGTDINSVPNRLPAIDFDCAVIAGDASINWINSLIIPGPDDGKVSVSRTRIEGLRAHVVMPVSHPYLMKDAGVIHQVIHYLAFGSFDQSAL